MNTRIPVSRIRFGTSTEGRKNSGSAENCGTKIKECAPWDDDESTPEELRDFLQHENLRLFEIVTEKSVMTMRSRW